jgi:hypothetical protein
MKTGVGRRYGAARSSGSMAGRQGGKAHNERWKKLKWADWAMSKTENIKKYRKVLAEESGSD